MLIYDSFEIEHDEHPRYTDVLYHGVPDANDDPADYLPRNIVIKAVRVG